MPPAKALLHAFHAQLQDFHVQCEEAAVQVPFFLRVHVAKVHRSIGDRASLQFFMAAMLAMGLGLNGRAVHDV